VTTGQQPDPVIHPADVAEDAPVRRPVVADDGEADHEGEVGVPVVGQRVHHLVIGGGAGAARERECEREERDRDGEHGVGEEDDSRGGEGIDRGLIRLGQPGRGDASRGIIPQVG